MESNLIEPKLVVPVYGDTDSVNSLTILKLQDNQQKNTCLTIESLYNESLKTTDKIQVTPNGSEIIPCNYKVLNWIDGELKYVPIKYIMRHKVTKEKWQIKTRTGKMIEVTGDHSLIVFRNGKKIVVKPREVLKTDKIICINED